MGFRSPDPACIAQWGEYVSFQPALGGGPFAVRLIRDEDAPEGPTTPHALTVLFGTMRDSFFTALDAPRPEANDTIVLDGIEYRVYEVRTDWAGGIQETAGLWLYLDRMENQ